MIEETCYGSSLRGIGFRLSTTLLLIFLIFTVKTGQAEDFDQDGINDANDLCLSTDLNGPVPTGILCDGCMGDDQTILGCNASDVLACKPGPNRRQFEMGINQRIQDTFSAQKGWAAKCGCDDNSDPDGDGFLSCVDECPLDGGKSLAGLCGCGMLDTDRDEDGTPDCVDLCPDNPGATVPDEYGLCASDSQVITAGEALVLTIGDSALSIPADALEAGMTVTLAEMDADLLDPPPNSEGESLITPVYLLAFSAAQPANAKLTFTFDIPSTITTGFYARIKIEGGLGTEGQSDSDWLIIPGEYDAQQSQLTIELGATATRFLVAGISTDAVAPAIAAGMLTNEVKDPLPMVTQSLAATAIESLVPTPEWASHGWVVFCRPFLFLSFGLTSCDPSSLDFEPMMNDMGSKLYASDKILTALGFPKGEVSRISAGSIERMWAIPHVIYDPDNRSITTASTTDDLYYFPVWIDPNNTDTQGGIYYPSSGVMYVDRVGIGPVGNDEFAIHELMHAVQYSEIKNAFGHDWITEGFAAAVQPFAPSNTAPSGGEFRFAGNWRDWYFPLSNDDATNVYNTSEFWLSLDGTLNLTPTFYDNLEGKGKLFDYSSYLTVDDALTDTGLPSLRDGYTNLILSRESDPDYLHCALPLFPCSGTSCELLTDTAPFSAQCFDIFIDEEDLCSGVETHDIKVTLVTDPEQFPFATIKLLVDGVIHDANTPVPYSEGRMWVINTTYTDNLSPTKATLKFEENCKVVTLIAQEYSIAATAGITTKPTFPREHAFNQDIKVLRSIEDPILANAYGYPFNVEEWAESNERAFKVHQYFLQNEVGDDTVEDTREDTITVIAPLGGGSQSLSASVSSSIGDGSATASASGTSNMVLNGENGVPIMFDWDFTVSRSLIFSDPSNIESGEANTGVLGFLYLNVASKNTAILEMSWDCSFFSVSVQKRVPDIITIENWNNGDSGCGVVRQFTLTEGSYVIKFQSNAGLDNILGGESSSGHLSLSVKKLVQ